MKLSIGIEFTSCIMVILLIACGCAPSPSVTMVSPISPTATPFQPVLPTLTSTPTVDADPIIEADATIDPPFESSIQTWEPGMITVPILLYHHISDTIDTQYNVTPARFAEQMKWLHDRGYATVTVADVARVILEGGDLPPRPVVLTFDDGYPDVVHNAYPILQQYGYVATFYIIGNSVDAPGSLSARKLKKLIDSGWEIGDHSMTHAKLTEGADLYYEIRQSKALLEDKLGLEMLTFAYPFGETDQSVTSYTINTGYIAAVGLGSIMQHDSANLYFLHRKEIKSWYGLDFFEEFMPWTD